MQLGLPPPNHIRVHFGHDQDQRDDAIKGPNDQVVQRDRRDLRQCGRGHLVEPLLELHADPVPPLLHRRVRVPIKDERRHPQTDMAYEKEQHTVAPVAQIVGIVVVLRNALQKFRDIVLVFHPV